MEFQYCILPSGNASEFLELDEELRRRRVRSEYWDLDSGGRIYRIYPEGLPNLPHDEEGPYLGTDNSGFTIYNMPDPEYNTKRWPGNGWHVIYQSTEGNSNASQAS